MSSETSRQLTSGKFRPGQKRKIRERVRRWPLFFWITPFWTILRLTSMRNALLSETDKSVLAQKESVDEASLNKIASIESIQKLIDINVASILNSFLVFLFVAVAIIAVYLSFPVSTTMVKMDVKVTSLEWDNIIEENSSAKRFNFSLPTTAVQNIFIDSSNFGSSRFGVNGYTELRLDSVEGLEFQNLSYPTNSRTRIQVDDNLGMNLSVYSLGDTLTKSLFTFDLTFLQANLYLPNSENSIHIGSSDINVPPQQASVSKDLRSGKVYILNFLTPAYWKWPTGLQATNISFAEKDARDDEPVSSIISGKVNMLETSDTAISLNERDILKTRFVNPVDVFISGDSSGIFVHLEGEVDALEFGPKILAEKNDRMPSRIKYISEKKPYAWVAVATLISLITLIKVRDR
jgi:hypothetical protein